MDPQQQQQYIQQLHNQGVTHAIATGEQAYTAYLQQNGVGTFPPFHLQQIPIQQPPAQQTPAQQPQAQLPDHSLETHFPNGNFEDVNSSTPAIKLGRAQGVQIDGCPWEALIVYYVALLRKFFAMRIPHVTGGPPIFRGGVPLPPLFPTDTSATVLELADQDQLEFRGPLGTTYKFTFLIDDQLNGPAQLMHTPTVITPYLGAGTMPATASAATQPATAPPSTVGTTGHTASTALSMPATASAATTAAASTSGLAASSTQNVSAPASTTTGTASSSATVANQAPANSPVATPGSTAAAPGHSQAI